MLTTQTNEFGMQYDVAVDERTVVTEGLQDFFVDLKDKLLSLFVRKDPGERGYYGMIWEDLKMD